MENSFIIAMFRVPEIPYQDIVGKIMMLVFVYFAIEQILRRIQAKIEREK